MIVLSNNIRSNSDIEYRAIFKKKEKGDVIAIEMKIDGEWSRTPGQWFVSTLMKDPVGDKLYIDYGANWWVTGMLEALANVPEDYNRFVSIFEKELASGS